MSWSVRTEVQGNQELGAGGGAAVQGGGASGDLQGGQVPIPWKSFISGKWAAICLGRAAAPPTGCRGGFQVFFGREMATREGPLGQEQTN